MSKSSVQRIIAVILFVVSVGLIGTGIYGISLRISERGTNMLSAMRLRSLLSISGEGIVEAMINIAKKEATAAVKAAGGSMAEIREATAKAEEETRANTQVSDVDLSTINTEALDAAVIALTAAQSAYLTQEEADKAAYREKVLAETDPLDETLDDMPPAIGETGVESIDDLSLEDTEPSVDMSGFTETEEMRLLKEAVDEKFVALSTELKAIFPILDDASLNTLRGTIIDLAYQIDDRYETQFDRFSKISGAATGDDIMFMRVIRYGDDLITVGIAVILLGLLILFYQFLLKALGLPRLIIGMFFVLLCVLSILYDLSISTLLSNTIVRMGMNSILVLAMVPGIQCGISLNLGLPLGIIGGLLGGLLCIEYGLTGFPGFVFAVFVGVIIAMILGYFYGLLLNRLKGSEMAITTYVGYSVVSLMCIGWLILPFTSLALRWPLGNGLRVTLSLGSSYRHILNNFLSFRIGDMTIPTGLLLFMGLCCLLVWMFSRSKTGIAMQAVGNNPRFAEATGISVDKMRIIGTVLSTVLGAVGIIVYSQSYGFMQLYTAPRSMGFIAASAILIGGASTSRARISHVLLGTFLFQGVLTLGMPVANVLVPQSTISETLRILISNGIILYALTKSGGGERA